MRNLIKTFLCLALIIATTGKELDESWWKTASFYQIYPRSFKDSNNDGIGDLKGITQKLSYLKEIGIDATWISPIFTSPMADFGYDISNYKDIEPIFGTMEDFDELMKKSKEIGMKIILDFVPNHTSDEHEWFIKSAKNDPDYSDFYVWHPGKIDTNGTRIPPSNWIAAFRGSMWEWHEERQAYYLHQYHIKQPDLNYNSPKVREAMKDVLRFWLLKGVAGFRIDTVATIYEVDPDADGNYPDEPRNPLVNNSADYDYLKHIYTKNQPRTYEVIYEFRQVLKEMDEELGGAQRILMTEAYEDIDFVMQYYGNDTVDGANFPFNFEMIRHVNRSSDAYVYSQTIHNWLDNMPEGRVANWVMGNHDVPRIGSRLGEDRIDIINILMKTLPGATITYQGEEIGMTGFLISWEQTVDPSGCQTNPQEYTRHSRDPARTPFQWSDGFQAGFTDCNTTWLPINPDYKLINVKRERGIAYSHLNIYKQLQTLRHKKTMRYGGVEVTALSKNILAIKRFLPDERTYLVLLNINDQLEAINAKSTFNDLSTKLKYVLTTDKSKRRKGEKVSSDHIELSPKEAVILATT